MALLAAFGTFSEIPRDVDCPTHGASAACSIEIIGPRLNKMGDDAARDSQGFVWMSNFSPAISGGPRYRG
jgi:hypothetical protein